MWKREKYTFIILPKYPIIFRDFAVYKNLTPCNSQVTRATSTPLRTVPCGACFTAISVLRFFALHTSASIISSSIVFVILTPSLVKCQSSLRNISDTPCFALIGSYYAFLEKPRLKKSKKSRVRWVCRVNVLLTCSSSRRKWRVVHVWLSMLRTFLFFSPFSSMVRRCACFLL